MHPTQPTGRITRRAGAITALAAAALVGACATPPPTTAAAIGELRPGILLGYIDREALPNSLLLLPPVPADDSATRAADQVTYLATRAAAAGPRGKMAASDARLDFPYAAGTFACAANLDIGPDTTPHLYTLLRRSFLDAGLATYRAKDNYQRTRPFVANKATSCTPAEEEKLSKDGSYPSGHSAAGWAWGLVLTELMPERADALLQRGYAFGQSRVVCGVHWQSDVDAGRFVGSGTVAQLHGNPVFRAQMREAAKEVAAARAAGRGTTRDCAAEAAALK